MTCEDCGKNEFEIGKIYLYVDSVGEALLCARCIKDREAEEDDYHFDGTESYH